MNYAEHYNRLIDKASNRVLSGYSEKHHVVPKCVGGTDAKENIVRLTPEEHYIAHQLLIKMYPSVAGLAYAAAFMTGANKNTFRNNKLRGWIARRVAAALSREKTGKRPPSYEKLLAAVRLLPRNPCSDITKQRIGSANKGRVLGPRSAESRAKQSASLRGRKLSDETKRKIASAHIGMRHPPEVIAKIAAAKRGKSLGVDFAEKMRQIVTGRKHTAEAKAKMSATKLARNRENKMLHDRLGAIGSEAKVG